MRAPQGPIETSARAERAVAAIRMLPSRNGVEVWMADETSGRSLLRQAIVDETKGGPNQNLIALQTAELLRTSLFPRSPPGAAKPASAPPAPVIVQIAPPPLSGESGLMSGFGLLYGAGGASPAWQIWSCVPAPVESASRDGPRGQRADPSRHDERARRHGRSRCDHRRRRGDRAFQVRAAAPLPHHRARGGVRVSAGDRTSSPGRERPAHERLHRRVYRSRLRAGRLGVEALELAGARGEAGSPERRSPGSMFDSRAATPATGACPC